MRAHGPNVLEALAAAVLAAGIAVALRLVPPGEWSRAAQPTTQAIYGFFLGLAVIGFARARGQPRLERASLALLLAAMPVVYLRAALEGAHQGARVWPEVVGVVLFAGAAVGGGWFRTGTPRPAGWSMWASAPMRPAGCLHGLRAAATCSVPNERSGSNCLSARLQPRSSSSNSACPSGHGPRLDALFK